MVQKKGGGNIGKYTQWKYTYIWGTCKMRNEIETKFIETKWNLPKRNEIETKRNKSKRNCFVSFRFREFHFDLIRFVSFRFRFAFYRYPNKDAVFQWCLLDSNSNWHNFHIFSSFYIIFSQSKNWITNQLQRELPFNLKGGGHVIFSIKYSDLKLGWKKDLIKSN